MVAANADVVGYPDIDHLQGCLPYGLVLGTFVEIFSEMVKNYPTVT